MRKVLLIVLVVSFVLCGCSSKTKDSSEVNVVKKTIVYCGSCAAESNESTKFCPNCGEEAKWLSEKPNLEPKETKHSYKEEYIKKLDDIAKEVEESEVYEIGSTADILDASDKEYEKWDGMLNEIYALLKTQLSEDEMSELRDKQREWIKYRDKTAEEESEREGGGGSLSSIVYAGVLNRETKERCYELVNDYLE